MERKRPARIGAIRLYLLNGGSLQDEDPKRRPQGHYADLLEQILLDVRDGCSLSFEIFEPRGAAFDKDSGTQHLLRLIEKGGHRAV